MVLNEGEYANPAGRLPYTWEKDMTQVSRSLKMYMVCII